MPPVLYKYCSSKGKFILANKEIKITPPFELNDPFELSPNLDVSVCDALLNTRFRDFEFAGPDKKDECRRRVKEMLSTPVEAAKLRNGLYEEFRILSLTSKNDNILMWGHYAERHTGLVIGFSPTHLFPEKGHHRVRYPEDVARPVFQATWEAIDKAKPVTMQRAFDVLITKAYDWKYENEYRILFARDESMEQRRTDGEMELISIPSKSIAEVIFGISASKDLKEEVLKILINNSELKHVKIFQATMDASKYRLNLNQVLLD